MIITTKLENVTKEGAKIGVHIQRERLNKPDEIPDMLDTVVGEIYETMEIVSILRALKDSNERAFNVAMEHFIEEELSNGESVR